MTNIPPRAKTLLMDVMSMLEEIEKARRLPAFAEVESQYIALGREIREYLQDEGVIQ